MSEQDLQLLYGELISRCWEDEEFKKRFVEDTKAVLKENGIPVDEAIEYRVIEAPPEDRYIILPATDVAASAREISKLFMSVSEQTDIIVPEGTRIIVLQNTAKINYIILKSAPEILSTVELDNVVGGGKNVAATINVVAAVNAAAVVSVHSIAGAAVAIAAGAAVVVGAAVFI